MNDCSSAGLTGYGLIKHTLFGVRLSWLDAPPWLSEAAGPPKKLRMSDGISRISRYTVVQIIDRRSFQKLATKDKR